MTHAQVTVFIILGVFVLMSLLIFLYYAQKIPVEAPEKAITSTLTKPITEYVTNCLEIAARDVLTTLGAQGGVLYQSQGGTILDPSPALFGIDYAVVDDARIPYLIVPPEQHIEPFFFTRPPHYPWDTFPFVEDADKPFLTGYYGINKLLPLHNWSQDSIQVQLERAVAARTALCTDWKQFETQGFTIKKEDPSARLVVAQNLSQLSTEETITFTLDWPIEVTDAHGSTTNLQAFTTTVLFPLGTIYYAVKSFIDKEVQDINNTPSSTSQYTFFVSHDVVHKDDVVTLQFPRVLLNNKPFEFRFARKNRPPALFYTKPEFFESHAWHAGIVFEAAGKKIIVKDPCPDTAFPSSMFLDSLDPDEDTVTYTLEPLPAEFKTPTGTSPPSFLRVFVSDGEYTDMQQFEITLTCCPTGCSQ